ncbi:hypothetical protein GWK16_24270 [Roseomonas sp. JC162]|uniref:Uncharacterized protein n=1 Tax=Neoroseomonas marina TaxID=1232220 RepID=A0A848EI81_9PROT|nr:hypothetical protein [Neoroseomonas marina]NMJ44384.1 hypothetical protein [Neoroseomonas marina]
MARRITTRDREAMLADFSYEARIAYVAFCAERCLAEARRHPAAAAQLENQPLLREGVELLWSAASGTAPTDKARVALVRDHVAQYERPHASGEAVVYARDITLVSAARVLAKGMRFLEDPGSATADFVVGALDGPAVLIGTIYEDAMASRREEVAVIDAALERLRGAAPPITRDLFRDIPDWPRGALTRIYASGQLTDSSVDED